MSGEKILIVSDSLEGPRNYGAISQQCDMQISLTAGKSLESLCHNLISNDRFEGLKNERIGQSASTLSILETGSETNNETSLWDDDIVHSIQKCIVIIKGQVSLITEQVWHGL